MGNKHLFKTTSSTISLRSMPSKKAQITTFVIAGLIILLIAVLLIYLNTRFDIGISEQGAEKNEVQAFVEQCIVQIADDALITLGQQGGHLFTDEFDIYSAEYAPFDSDVLVLDNGATVLPYWLYQREGGLDQSEMPELMKRYEQDGSIQDQLERYMEEQLPNCLRGFVDFNPKGILVDPQEELAMNVVIAQRDVEFQLDYPLSVTMDGKQEELNSFVVTKPVALQKVYNLAREIVQYESETVFLEDNTISLISTYGRNDDSSFPSMYGNIEAKDCSEMDYWFASDVEDKFGQMLNHNVGFFRVDNAAENSVVINSNVEPDANNRDIRQGVFKGFEDRVSNNNYPSVDVWFDYEQNYPLFVDLGGRGIVQPQRLKIDALVAQFCVFEYKFVYDIKYPVVVSLKDDSSRVHNDPYLFRFPIQVIVKENYPRVRLLDVLADDLELPVSECEIDGGSADNVVRVQEKTSGVPIERAHVYFQCGPEYMLTYDETGKLDEPVKFADKCFVGATDTLGQFSGALPECGGGAMVTIEHPDYVSTTKLVGNVLGDSSLDTTVDVSRLKTFTVDVNKFFVAPPLVRGTTSAYQGIVTGDEGEVLECNLNPNIAKLQNHERVFVSLKEINLLGGSLGRTHVVNYELGKDNTIELGPGTYQVEAILFRDERYPGEMTIAKNSQSISIEGTIASPGKTIYYPKEDVELPTTISGGINTIIEITDDDLEKGTFVLNVIDEGVPKVVEHVGIATQHFDTCYSLNSAVLAPRIR